jgi:hypothetical protein
MDIKSLLAKRDAQPEANAAKKSKFWEDFKRDFAAAFAEFAKAQGGDAQEDVVEFLEPLHKAAWGVAEKYAHESWRNAMAKAGAKAKSGRSRYA